MRTVSLLVIGLVVAGLGSTAEARRPPPPPESKPQPQWDSRGWQLLGEQQVGGGSDKDTIRVGRYEGRFSKLTLVVTDSDLELQSFSINFADRTTYDPRVQQYFREGQRTRVIDLPPNGGLISHIDLRYRNLPGGGRAKVQIWGFKTADVAQPQPVYTPPQWDQRGWTMLGETTVRGNVDKDMIQVGRRDGRISKLTLVVLDSDLELLDFVVNFKDRSRFEPRTSHVFREGQRTRVIDLPGDTRLISHIDLKYRNIAGGGRAKVQVWGFKAAETPAPAPQWDSRGWTLLGETTVRGRVDKDTIQVGRRQGRFDRVTLVVSDSDLELLGFTIRFADRTTYDPKLAHYFKEGQRTRVVDLPPNGGRIQAIELAYRNLPGGGRAKVQVWGYKVSGGRR